MRWMTLGAVFSMMANLVQVEDVLWKCHDPDQPFRFATSEEKKDEQTPPCKKWIQMRGKNLALLLSQLGDSRFEAANVFLMKASRSIAYEYPGSDMGAPVPTSELYQEPEQFGFTVASLADAQTGSIVVYDGLGGILVEVRASPEDEWSKQVLYPSAKRQFGLAVRDPAIPGKQSPKVLEY